MTDEPFTVQESRRIIRAFVQQHFDDERLAQVLAFNADGAMEYGHPCSCLLGVTRATYLHTGYGACGSHYQAAKSLTFEYGGSARSGSFAEIAYFWLARRSHSLDTSCIDPNPVDSDRLRRIRLNSILLAEIRRRDRVRERERIAASRWAPTPSELGHINVGTNITADLYAALKCLERDLSCAAHV